MNDFIFFGNVRSLLAQHRAEVISEVQRIVQRFVVAALSIAFGSTQSSMSVCFDFGLQRNCRDVG
jgi:hypothetical protein